MIAKLCKYMWCVLIQLERSVAIMKLLAQELTEVVQMDKCAIFLFTLLYVCNVHFKVAIE